MLSRELRLPKDKTFFLFGPRQTGKTSLVNALFPSEACLNLNLLLSSQYTKFAANPTAFREEVLALPPKVSHVFVDEVQRVPDLLNEVHALIETKIPQQFILTGSSARKLKRGKANLLGGRAWTLNLHPLTVAELGPDFHLHRALSYGTLPAIYLDANTLNATELLRSYVDTYLKEEVEAEALSRNIGGFIRFLSSAAQMNAELINYSNIARDVQISPVTVREYFKVLEDTLVGNFLLHFHRSERKKHKLAPKFYFFDTGVLRAMQKRLSLEIQPMTFEFGNYFETWVINEVRRISSYHRKDLTLSYLRTANDVEVDLIIETPRGEVIAIEIKSKPLPQELDFAAGFRAIRSLVPNARCLCVCTGDATRKVGDAEVWSYSTFLEFIRAL